jgi:hypothetical protein
MSKGTARLIANHFGVRDEASVSKIASFLAQTVTRDEKAILICNWFGWNQFGWNHSRETVKDFILK